VGKLEIPIVTIPRKTALAIHEDVDIAEVLGDETDPGTLTRIKVDGELTAIQQNFLFQGTVTGVFASPCDRCLEPTSLNEKVDVGWLFEPGEVPDAMNAFAESDDTDDEEDEVAPDEDDGQARYYDGESVNLGPHAWEELVIATPSKLYCDDACKGLCPQCGINLNTATCACVEEQLEETNNSGLSGLKEMFPDLPAKSPEE
jgi:uncharacterized metal-binding protein YceD (DUF177 family)